MNVATTIQIELPTAKKFRSERQRLIYQFIVSHWNTNGFSPTIREIGANTGITSTSVVNYNLNQLIEDGWLRHAGYGKSRGFLLCDQGANPASQVPTPSGVNEELAGEVIRRARAVIRRLEEDRYYCPEMIGLATAIRAFEGGKK